VGRGCEGEDLRTSGIDHMIGRREFGGRHSRIPVANNEALSVAGGGGDLRLVGVCLFARQAIVATRATRIGLPIG
jgi:hypothetical protein